VIISAPEYSSAADSLVNWKRRKGFHVVKATTDETGTTKEDIKDWLQWAYDAWDTPPEYLLLLGDVDTIPAWNFSGNVSDLPYALLDGEDWLPDLHIGRISVESIEQAATVINKTVRYERTPFTEGDENWFARSLMVAGDYGSVTPTTTVTWCGEQLESIGFDPAATVFFPPTFNGIVPITNYLEDGVSICAYRGWAYGTHGWEPPHFIAENISDVDNGAMTPVVMSFVCLNGDFEGQDPCFGEVFIRQGTPEESKGAIAFIGNGEHWSHTRYNDVMAITTFERIVDSAITNLGQLQTASKLRFAEYFPHELGETGDEASVEFYFHIYNLLGDPELNFWKSIPSSMIVEYATELPSGQNFLEFQVFEEDGVTPLKDARVGLVRETQLLGSAWSDSNGKIYLFLEDELVPGVVELTITAPGHRPYLATVNVSNLDGYAIAQELNPSILTPAIEGPLSVNIRNIGLSSLPATTAFLSTETPGVIVTNSQAAFPPLGGGSSAWSLDEFRVQTEGWLSDESIVTFQLDFQDGQINQLGFEIVVEAPRIQIVSTELSGDGIAMPEETVDLIVNLSNMGQQGTLGGTGTLTLNSPGATDLIVAEAEFGAMNPGEETDNASNPYTLQIHHAEPIGTQIFFTMQFVSVEGLVQSLEFVLSVGEISSGDPVGPCAYGYFAVDSGDLDYPNERPEYFWEPLSPEYGGVGQELVFPDDSYPTETTTLLLSLPFSFTYFGSSYDEIRVSDNGWISFDPSDFFDFYNWVIPSTHGNHSLVAPFWDNFVVFPDEDLPNWELRDGIYQYYDPIAGTITIEWSHMRHFRPEFADLQTFQVKLFDPVLHPTITGDGEILFLFNEVVDSDSLRNFASVGIESPDETDGLLYSYAGILSPGASTLGPGLAVKFTTDPPVYSGETGLPEQGLPMKSGISAYPNPFNPHLTISFSLLTEAQGSLVVHDVSGRQVRTLKAGQFTQGTNEFIWNGQDEYGLDVASGVYFVRLVAGEYQESKKVVLLR